MNAARAAAAPTSDRQPLVGLLRALLIVEAFGGLAVTIVLSMLASQPANAHNENALRFAAGGTILFAIFAALTARGARLRRPSSWTRAAILQVVVAVGTGVAVLVAEWHPAYLAGFGVAVLVMLVLSSGPVREALGQA